MAREVLAVAGPVLQPGAEGQARLAAACHGLMTGALTRRRPRSWDIRRLPCCTMRPLPGRSRRRPLRQKWRGAVPHRVPSGRRSPGGCAGPVAGLSRAHFVRRFAAEVGVPPSDHVFARGMDRVERCSRRPR